MRDMSNVAEQAAGKYISRIGFFPVQIAGEGPDGGVDVRVPGQLVAQVKLPRVGRPVVQQIYGVAQSESAKAAVFGARGFTRDAEDWANSHEIGLFLLKNQFGRFKIIPVNNAARSLGTVSSSGTFIYWLTEIFRLLFQIAKWLFRAMRWILGKKSRVFVLAVCIAAYYLFQYFS